MEAKLSLRCFAINENPYTNGFGPLLVDHVIYAELTTDCYKAEAIAGDENREFATSSSTGKRNGRDVTDWIQYNLQQNHTDAQFRLHFKKEEDITGNVIFYIGKGASDHNMENINSDRCPWLIIKYR